MPPSLPALAATLKASPMFQLSLSSLELFHSNFLAWLFNTHPNAVQILGLDALDHCEVLREKKHFDLTIRADHTDIAIIENKVKSIPDLDQLLRYESLAGGPTKILLTLWPASFTAENWRSLSYEALAKNLGDWLTHAKATLPETDRVFIQEYQRMISALSLLVRRYLADHKPADYWFNPQHRALLADIRFIDTVQKFHAARFQADLIDRLERDPKLRHFLKNHRTPDSTEISIGIHARFFNKSPSISIFIEKPGHKQHPTIEIQGDQYRRMLSFDWGHAQNPKGESRAETVRHHAKAIDGYRWLFAEDKPDKSFVVQNWVGKEGPYKSNMRGPLASYHPAAIYQYINIASRAGSPDGHLPYEQIMERVLDDVRHGIALLNDETWLKA